MKNSKPVLNFNSFINEAKSNDEVDILILSNGSKPSKTAKSFLEECKSKNIVCNVVNIDTASLEKIYNGHIISYIDDDSINVTLDLKIKKVNRPIILETL
jgi:hypothetical protein